MWNYPILFLFFKVVLGSSGYLTGSTHQQYSGNIPEKNGYIGQYVDNDEGIEVKTTDYANFIVNGQSFPFNPQKPIWRCEPNELVKVTCWHQMTNLPSNLMYFNAAAGNASVNGPLEAATLASDGPTGYIYAKLVGDGPGKFFDCTLSSSSFDSRIELDPYAYDATITERSMQINGLTMYCTSFKSLHIKAVYEYYDGEELTISGTLCSHRSSKVLCYVKHCDVVGKNTPKTIDSPNRNIFMTIKKEHTNTQLRCKRECTIDSANQIFIIILKHDPFVYVLIGTKFVHNSELFMYAVSRAGLIWPPSSSNVMSCQKILEPYITGLSISKTLLKYQRTEERHTRTYIYYEYHGKAINITCSAKNLILFNCGTEDTMTCEETAILRNPDGYYYKLISIVLKENVSTAKAYCQSYGNFIYITFLRSKTPETTKLGYNDKTDLNLDVSPNKTAVMDVATSTVESMTAEISDQDLLNDNNNDETDAFDNGTPVIIIFSTDNIMTFIVLFVLVSIAYFIIKAIYKVVRRCCCKKENNAISNGTVLSVQQNRNVHPMARPSERIYESTTEHVYESTTEHVYESVTEHVYNYPQITFGQQEPSAEPDISQRPPYPLPPEATAPPGNAPYLHYDTPYEFRIFRMGVPAIRVPERFRRRFDHFNRDRRSQNL